MVRHSQHAHHSQQALPENRQGGDLLGPMWTAGPFFAFQRHMNRIFEEVMHHSFDSNSELFSQQEGAMSPNINFSENEKEVRVTAELPGVAEEDIDVSVQDDVLMIRGHKELEAEEDDNNYHVHECRSGDFSRTLRLPWSVDPDEVEAHFSNGVLDVILRKSKRHSKGRKIEIQ